MATFTLVNSFGEAMAEGKHNLSSNQLTVALTNTEHVDEWDELEDLTQVEYTNLSTRNFITSSSSQTLGTYTLGVYKLTLTASGAVGPFRYVYIYNDTATNDELLGYYDYGSAVTLASTDTFAIGAASTFAIFTIS